MLATIRLWHYILGNNKRNHFLSIFFMLRTVIKSKDPYIFIIPICIKNIVKTTLLWSRTTVVYTLTCNVNRTKLFHDRMRLLKNRTASKRLMSESRYINRVYDLFRSNGDRRPIRIIVVLSKLVSGRLSNTWDEIYIYIYNTPMLSQYLFNSAFKQTRDGAIVRWNGQWLRLKYLVRSRDTI